MVETPASFATSLIVTFAIVGSYFNDCANDCFMLTANLQSVKGVHQIDFFAWIINQIGQIEIKNRTGDKNFNGRISVCLER